MAAWFADSLMARLMAAPWWLQAWVGWMMVANTASVVFLRHREARWVLTVWIGNVITMMALYEAVGYVRLLGLSHVLWWTPLLAYLFAVRGRFAQAGAFGAWARALTVTIAVSLVIDYIDVIRYFMGDGALGG
ncbi:hypothetical protein PC39_14412 [Salinisphaera sp. PC39]|uniref:hypothetical protein n=1 Tax=Salinisphaera sp. PC39 TaxID=1304156 RepID=UPI00333E3211